MEEEAGVVRLKVVKGSGSVMMGKAAGGQAVEAWRKAFEEGRPSLAEEPESEVEDSGDETEAKAGWMVSAKHHALRARYARQAKIERKRWRLATGKNDMLGYEEGNASTYYALRTRESNGEKFLEATEVSSWIAFKPEIRYEVMAGAVAETALKDGQKSGFVDVAAARAAMPWRNKGRADDEDLFKEAKKKKAGASSRFSRLAQKLDEDDEDNNNFSGAARRGGGGTGGTGKKNMKKEAIFGDSGTRLDIGLSAVGGDADEAEMLEGMGDDGLDFDLNEDFQDDEAELDEADVDKQVVDVNSDDEDAELNVDDDDAEENQKNKKKKKKQLSQDIDDEQQDEEEQLGEEAPPLGNEEASPMEVDDEEEPLIATNKRKQEAIAAPAPAKRAKVAASLNGPLTTMEVKAEMISRGGRCKLRDLLQHFKPRIKGDAHKKNAIKRILKDIVDISDDATEGRILVLKAHLRPDNAALAALM